MNVQRARRVMTTAASAVSLALTACAADETISDPGGPGVVHLHGVAPDPEGDGAVCGDPHRPVRIDDGDADLRIGERTTGTVGRDQAPLP